MITYGQKIRGEFRASDNKPRNRGILSLKHAQSLPSVTALYFCTNYDQLLYVGITGNLNQRWRSHHKVVQLISFNDVQIHWLAIAPEQISPELERQFIDYWEPKLNGKTHKPPELPFNKVELYKLLGDPEITGETAKVLFAFICHLDFNNFIRVSLTEIAVHLHTYRSNESLSC